MRYPIFSIAVATFNSEKTIRKTLNSIRKQTYPKYKTEILIIDGGSTDNTIKIAKEYNTRIIFNARIEDIYAKQIGFIQAKGQYLMYLDSDEVLDNRNSLKLKNRIFAENANVKSILISGYKTPLGYSSINYYINDFGDPFSYFIYRDSKGIDSLIKELEKKYIKVKETKDAVIFNFQRSETLPLIELFAGGCAIDLEYCRENFPKIKKNPELIPMLFYLLNNHGFHLAVSKNDSTIHYSTPNTGKYLKKISSRVKNNIFLTARGKSGYSGREKFQKSDVKWKKYLFIPYALSLFFPIYDAFNMFLAKRKFIYFLHVPLSVYTAFLILYFYILKTLRIQIKVTPYGT